MQVISSVNGQGNESDQSLSAEQTTALDRLLAGDSVTEAARAAGVHRATVHRWLQGNQEFLAAWNRGRTELWESTATKLLKLAPKALAVIERALDADDVPASLAVLKGLGMLTGKPMKGDSGKSSERKAAAVPADELPWPLPIIDIAELIQTNAARRTN